MFAYVFVESVMKQTGTLSLKSKHQGHYLGIHGLRSDLSVLLISVAMLGTVGCSPDVDTATHKDSESVVQVQGGLIEDGLEGVNSVENDEAIDEEILIASDPPAVDSQSDAPKKPADTKLNSGESIKTAALEKESKIGSGDGKEPFVEIDFDTLASFTYDMPEEEVADAVESAESPKVVNKIPDHIQKFNKMDVALMGFMLPLKVEKGLVTEMLIMRDQSMCCYGTVPKINEWVSVRMQEKGVDPVMDQPVTLFGKFHVGEVYENEYLVGIYEMDGVKMTTTIDP